MNTYFGQGGVFGKALEPDFNFAHGITFAKTFFQNWPQDVDMVFSPMEAGNCRYQLPGSEEWSAQMLEKIRYANKQR